MNLSYDFENLEGRLAYVRTNYPNYYGMEITQINKLNYGNYVTSDDKVESVLVSVEQRTSQGDKILDNVDVVRKCKQCPIYDKLEADIAALNNRSQIGV